MTKAERHTHYNNALNYLDGKKKIKKNTWPRNWVTQKSGICELLGMSIYEISHNGTFFDIKFSPFEEFLLFEPEEYQKPENSPFWYEMENRFIRQIILEFCKLMTK